MQFQVPQFIETEDTIVGPLTLKQFLYVGLSAIFCFLLFFILQVWLWLIIAAVLMVTSAAFAFIKINGRPMNVFARAAFGYVWSPRLYTLKPKDQTAKTVDPRLAPPRATAFGGIRSLLDKMTTSKDAIPKRERSVSGTDFGISKEDAKRKYEVVRKIAGDREIGRRIDYR